MRLRFILSEVWQGLRRNSTMALSVVIVTFVSLAFVGAAALLQIQVDKLKDDWFDRVEVTIFMCPEVSLDEKCQEGRATPAQEEVIRNLLDNGALSGFVDTWYYESAEQAYERFVETEGEDSIWAQHLDADDMQASFRVKLVNPEKDFDTISEATAPLDGVHIVVDQKALFSKLFAALNGATLVAAGLAGVMALAAWLLITTTIRLSALSRRRETTIMRMVGSSKTLIQMPFMLEGAIAATLGAVASIAGLWFAVRYAVEGWATRELDWVEYISTADVMTLAPWLVLIAIGLSGIASLISIGRYTNA